MKLSEIQIRDPFVYTENGRYYLYGSTDSDIWKGDGHGFNCFGSSDLEEFEPYGNVFDRPDGYWGKYNFWAPEMHTYKGKYYLFASFKADGVCRGTAVLKADAPKGPFRPWSEGALTPRDWECLDGTLFVENGIPYLVFCHEWVQVGDGEVCALRLSDDLSHAIGEPRLLFKASEAKWTKAIGHSSGIKGYVTDGPNMYRAKDGKLLMLWSSISPAGYTIGAAESDDGTLCGNWLQNEKPIFDKDGGHGMIFKDFNGRELLAIHRPNHTPDERAVFLEVEYVDGKLRLKA
ncbi:MAG: family 43 glycosylhydrolase [Clostridia bacterium]|nr:family 43 glycosylhydrolase [Clostridia bacterium]